MVNASNIEKDFAHLQRANADIGALLENQSDQLSLLAVQGPEAAALLQEFTPVDLTQIPFYQFAEGSFGSIESVLISATGYTGAGGFELYCKNQDAPLLWELIRSKGIQPIGLAARDTLRLPTYQSLWLPTRLWHCAPRRLLQYEKHQLESVSKV